MSTVAEEKLIFTREVILDILSKPYGSTRGKENRYLIYRMLQAMVKRQTNDEIASENTKYNNGVGFNGFDAQFLTDVALKSRAYNNLSHGQAKAVGRALKKYIGQLCEIAGVPKKTTAQVEKEPAQQGPLDFDDYVCQKCGGVFNSGLHPPQWRLDAIARPNGQVSIAGNVCPGCAGSFNPNEAPRIVRHALGTWAKTVEQCSHSREERQGYVCTGCGSVFDQPLKK